MQCNDPVVIYKDNQGTIELTKNQKHNPRTKHIDLKYHFVRDTIMDRIIEVKYCPTEDMMADIFTKALSKVKFEKMRTLIGVNCALSTLQSGSFKNVVKFYNGSDPRFKMAVLFVFEYTGSESLKWPTI